MAKEMRRNWYDSFHKSTNTETTKENTVSSTSPLNKKKAVKKDEEYEKGIIFGDLNRWFKDFNFLRRWEDDLLTMSPLAGQLTFNTDFKDIPGFVDMGPYYQLSTTLGGYVDVDMSNVNVEVTDGNRVTISYKHHTGETQKSYTSYAQMSIVSLPEDADAKTLVAFLDENNNVIVQADKIDIEKKVKNPRTIPVQHK